MYDQSAQYRISHWGNRCSHNHSPMRDRDDVRLFCESQLPFLSVYLSTAILILIVSATVLARTYIVPGDSESANDSATYMLLQERERTLPDHDAMTDKEHFDLLYTALKELVEDYYEDVMKTVAFLVIAIGWFVTSTKSREFLRNNTIIRRASLATVFMIAVIHIRSEILTYQASKTLHSLLVQMNYIDLSYFAHYKITNMQLITNGIQNTALFGVLLVILYSLEPPKQTG